MVSRALRAAEPGVNYIRDAVEPVRLVADGGSANRGRQDVPHIITSELLCPRPLLAALLSGYRRPYSDEMGRVLREPRPSSELHRHRICPVFRENLQMP